MFSCIAVNDGWVFRLKGLFITGLCEYSKKNQRKSL
jgi:hypothetical protein